VGYGTHYQSLLCFLEVQFHRRRANGNRNYLRYMPLGRLLYGVSLRTTKPICASCVAKLILKQPPAICLIDPSPDGDT
jgi:hypothetical protein